MVGSSELITHFLLVVGFINILLPVTPCSYVSVLNMFIKVCEGIVRIYAVCCDAVKKQLTSRASCSIGSDIQKRGGRIRFNFPSINSVINYGTRCWAGKFLRSVISTFGSSSFLIKSS